MNNSTLTTFVAATILTANLGPRFRGRAALVKAAQGGNDKALALLTATPAERRIAALRGTIDRSIAVALGYGPELDARDLKHYERFKQYAANQELLKGRLPGNVAKRATLRAFMEALKVAGFRTATHDHSHTVEFVTPGQEFGSSKTGKARPDSVGLSKSYAKKAFWVTTSQHTWRVSTEFFRVSRSLRAAPGYLRLSPHCYVTQGRGCSLVVHTD